MRLLGAVEAPPFELFNPEGRGDVVLVCDHASNQVPECLGTLGLEAGKLDAHIAWDAGAAELSRQLAERLDAPLVLANYSRLVIDCNRRPGSADSIPAASGGIAIPGNRCPGAIGRALRQRDLFDPYHRAIRRLLDERAHSSPALLAIHSFSPVLRGRRRPWSIGVCYGEDRRLADLLLAALKEAPEGPLGDNAPYSIEADIDFTLPHHAGARGLAHVMLEIRRDRIRTKSQVSRLAGLLAQAWKKTAAQRRQT